MKRVELAAKIVWVAAMLGLLGWFVATHSGEFLEYTGRNGLIALGAAGACLLAGKLALAQLTVESLRIFSVRLSFWKAFWIYALSQLGKFLPGSIWHFVGRVLLYRGEGLAAKDGAKLLVIENFWLLSSALLLGAAACAERLLSLSGGLPALGFTPPFWMIAATILAAWLALLPAGTRLFVSRFAGHPISTPRVFVLQALVWTALGLSFWVLLPAEVRQVETLVPALGAFALGWVAGYLVPFAPAGVGVREAVIVALMAEVVPIPVAIAAASVNRLLYTAIDLALGGLAASRYRIGKDIGVAEKGTAESAGIDPSISAI